MNPTDRKPSRPSLEMMSMCSALFRMLLVTLVALLSGETVLLVWQRTAIGNVVYFSVYALGLIVVALRSRRRAAQQHCRDVTVPGTRVTVHAFVVHLKMHPERLPEGMTEADLEYFRKEFGGNHQEDANTWTQWVQEWSKQPS
jgi:uncharacterized membrane protein